MSGDLHQGGKLPHPGAVEALTREVAQMQADAETGWEAERALCFAAQSSDRAVGADLAGPDFAGDDGGYGGLAGDLVRLGRALERGADADPVTDATTTHQHTDRRLLQKVRQKKIALGHKGNDKEEHKWEQTM